MKISWKNNASVLRKFEICSTFYRRDFNSNTYLYLGMPFLKFSRASLTFSIGQTWTFAPIFSLLATANISSIPLGLPINDPPKLIRLYITLIYRKYYRMKAYLAISAKAGIWIFVSGIPTMTNWPSRLTMLRYILQSTSPSNVEMIKSSCLRCWEKKIRSEKQDEANLYESIYD